MSSEFTHRQSGEDQRQAQQLSLQKSQPPATVPGYQLETFLGSGAYGEVWVGTDQNTGRQVAVKFYLHSGGVDWSLLSREVENWCSCQPTGTSSNCWMWAGTANHLTT